MEAAADLPAPELGRALSLSRIRIHLDTDIGGDLDDLCALALLLGAPDVELTGVTTVLDHAGRRAGYAKYALDLGGRDDVPVAAGADVALGRFKLETGLPPEEQYWPEPIVPRPGPLDAALDLLERSVAAGATLIGIGPPTNLALVEQRQPGSLRNTNVVLMGGHIRTTPPGFPIWGIDVDYNVQCDPEAARAVLESAEVTLVPIEVSVQTALRREHLAALRRGDPLAQLIAHQAEAFATHWDNESRYGLINFQHDPLACAVALGWPGVTVETLSVTLDDEDAWLRLREDPAGHPTRVVTAVDAEAFATYWLETVTRARDA